MFPMDEQTDVRCYTGTRAAALLDHLVQDLHGSPRCTAAESGGAVYVYGPSAIQDHRGGWVGGETCTRRVPQCFREGRESGGVGGWAVGGLCHCEEAFEWQQLASEESTNHKNDHTLDKETNGETT